MSAREANLEFLLGETIKILKIILEDYEMYTEGLGGPFSIRHRVNMRKAQAVILLAEEEL